MTINIVGLIRYGHPSDLELTGRYKEDGGEGGFSASGSVSGDQWWKATK